MDGEKEQDPVRIAFFGTPYVARDTLAILVARGYAPAIVISSPDARKGRGALTILRLPSAAFARPQPLFETVTALKVSDVV